MSSLKYLLVLGTLLTASAFTADILAPYIGPLEYKGSMGYTYVEGTNPITRITIDSTVAEKLIVLNPPAGWTYTLTDNILELEGGSLNPGESVTLPVSLGGYIPPDDYPVTSTGYTSGGEAVQASGSLVVSTMVILYALDTVSAMRNQLAMATLGLGLIELIISRMLQKKPEVESVVDMLQPYQFGGPPQDDANRRDLRNLIQNQEPYFADNTRYTPMDGTFGPLKRTDTIPSPSEGQPHTDIGDGDGTLDAEIAGERHTISPSEWEDRATQAHEGDDESVVDDLQPYYFGGPPRAHDGTSYEDLFEQAVNRIPNHSPDWTDHDVHDPGVTIMELLSSITQDLGYQVNYSTRDFSFLSGHDLTGGQIRELVIDSVSSASEKGEHVNIEHIKAVFEKLKK